MKKNSLKIQLIAVNEYVNACGIKSKYPEFRNI